ncbi:proton-coupled folate transporter-like [Acanthaster planci]|uniref:Proton-coupled folate transporter n=1 Tax=Acanthaster planci TaxID=133434 RepID=A0A8B7YP97_ACAPL|nr:proton-coupled folate transporter-like [Acanthaster planci]
MSRFQSEKDHLLTSRDDEGDQVDSEWTGSRLRASKRWITVEPVLMVAFAAVGVHLMISVEYLQSLVARDRAANGSHLNQSCTSNASDPAYQLQQEIQSETSLWAMYLQLCAFGLAALTTPVISAWSDNYGRKVPIFVCCAGILANCAVYLAATSLDLPRYVLFVGEALQGLTGNMVLISPLSLAYIADITREKQRTLRFVVITGTTVLGVACAQFGVGYAVDSFGFAPVYAALCVALGVVLLYIAVPTCLLETRQADRNKETTAEQFGHAFGGIASLFSVKEDKRHIRLILLSAINFTGNFLFQGASALAILYVMAAPICWSAVTVGTYTAVSLTSMCFGTLVGGATLPRCFKEGFVLYICCASYLSYNLITGLVTSTELLFVGAVTGCLRYLQLIVLTAIVSKTVTAGEQGVALGIVTVLGLISLFVAPLVCNATFAATVEFFPGLTFVAMAGASVLPVPLIMILQCMTPTLRKKSIGQDSDKKSSSYGGIDESISALTQATEDDNSITAEAIDAEEAGQSTI